MKHFLSRSALFLSLATVVAACSGVDLLTSESDVEVVCPEVNVIRDTDHITRFIDGPGRDITDILFEADLRRAGGLCNVKSDEVTVTLILDIDVTKGAALTDNIANLGVNIGIYDAERNLVAPPPIGLRQLPIKVTFAGNNPLAIYNETVTIVIPKEEETPAEDFQVFVSLDMTKSEYKFNQENQ